MSTWTAIPTSVLEVGQPIRSIDIIALRDNILAVPAGAAGAPRVQGAALASGSIRQAQLRTATASVTITVAVGTGGAVALTGATFSWWTAGGDDGNSLVWGRGNTAPGTVGVYNIGSTTGQFHVDERFIQASPPYTHGPLFVFLLLDSTGAIVGSSVAPDPPWAYHGPTDITPQRVDMQGRSWRKQRLYDGLSLDEVKKRGRGGGGGDQRLLQRVMRGEVAPVETEVEITLACKDTDADVCPHPWFPNRPAFFAGRTVVMLEPGTALMQRLAQIAAEDHARTVLDLITDGELTIDNTPLAVPGVPSAVRAHRARWKLTP